MFIHRRSIASVEKQNESCFLLMIADCLVLIEQIGKTKLIVFGNEICFMGSGLLS